MKKYLLLSFLCGIVNLSGFAQPTISSFTPTSGVIGTTVTINGTNFDPAPANNIVYFGAVEAVVSASTTTKLIVIVPAGATFQPVTVTTNRLTAYSAKPFIVTFAGGGNGFTPSSFAAPVNVLTDQLPKGIMAGDLDNDGKPDFAVADYIGYSMPGSVSVFRNTSTGDIISFDEKKDLTTGISPASVVMSDLDGDGKLDLIIANLGSNTVSCFKNTSTNGNISFDAKKDYTTGNGPISVTAGDVDGDGKPDLVVANGFPSSTVSVLKNTSANGIISFAAKVDFTTGSYPQRVAIADIDGDGRPDLAVANNNGGSLSALSILRNTSTNGVISFAAKIDFVPAASAISIGDLDGDGKPDIALAGGYAGVSILRNTSTSGTISFATKIDYNTGVTNDVSIADFDGDGNPDLATANSYPSNSVSLFRNISTKGTISFANKVDYAFGFPVSLSSTDFDGDGKPDIAGPSDNTTVSIIRNQVVEPGITYFSPVSANAGDTITITGTNFTNITAVSIGGRSVASYTVESSTNIVAVVAENAEPGDVTVTNNYGTATIGGFSIYFPPVITSVAPTSGIASTTVNIQGENFDPVDTNNTVFFGAVKAVVTAATATSLKVTAPVSSTYEPISVLNNPNKLTAFSKLPLVLTFPGGGNTNSFAPKNDIPTGQPPYRLAMGDLDGDGKPDLVIADGEAVSIYRNTSNHGTISFAEKVILTDSIGVLGDIVVSDFNGDGKKDITIFTGTLFVGVYENTSMPGIISFAPKVVFEAGGIFGMTTGDIDGDGRPDLITSNYTSISILRNTSTNGNISFASKIDFAVNAYGPIAVGDLDGDGKADVALLNSIVSVLRNTGTKGVISFAAPANFSIGEASNQNTGIAIGDLDGDGKPELAVTLTYYNFESDIYHRVDIFRNTGTNGVISFAPKIEYTTGQYPYSVAINDLNGDGKPDLAVTDWEGFGQQGDIAVFTNMSTVGTISFSSYYSGYSVGSSPVYNAVADLDGDGKSDIAVVNQYSNTVSILRNQTSLKSPVISGVTNIFTTSAVVHWYPAIGPVSFIVRAYPKGTKNYQYYPAVTDTFTTIHNLQPATKYLVQVEAIYSGTDTSNWSASFAFTTLDSCPAPSNLKARVNKSSALLMWTFPYVTTSGFRVDYRVADSTSAWITKLVSAEKRKTIIRDLLPDTRYMWRVANECGDDLSAWVKGPFFLTFNTSAYSLNMASGIQIDATGSQVIPNPNNGNFNIKMQLPAKQASTVLALYDVFGTKVWQQDEGNLSGNVNKNISLNGVVAAGTYILVIQRSDIKLVQKIVINE
jgi:hypothetical protein